MAFKEAEIKLVEGVAREITLAIAHRKLIAQERYKDTVSTITAWAADLAHDINNVVGKIGNRAMWIKEPGAGQEKIDQYANEIITYAGQLEGFGPGGEQSGVEEIQLDKEVESQVKAMLRKPKLQVQFVCEAGCPGLAIQANPRAFSRILHHLVSNAVEAMEGEGILTTRTHQMNDQWVEIQVQDSGPGIPERFRPLIFQEPVTTEDDGGGYGLILTRQAVEGMGGRIRLLDSPPGHGALFSIRLPIKPPSTKDSG
jgi:signal transduction histidine kinase